MLKRLILNLSQINPRFGQKFKLLPKVTFIFKTPDVNPIWRHNVNIGVKGANCDTTMSIFT